MSLNPRLTNSLTCRVGIPAHRKHEIYIYDAAGNNQNDNAVYNILNNRLTASDIYTITYDSMGNIKSKHNKLTHTTSNYTFNARNQLVSYEQLDDANQKQRHSPIRMMPLTEEYLKQKTA